MSTSLFLLFKEYADASKATSATYIEATPLVSSDEILNYFDRWIKVVKFFSYERCNRYYDSKNIENILYPYKLLEKEYSEQDDEYPTTAMLLASQFLSLGLMDWREEADEQPQESYFYYECDVTADTFGEMARHKKQSKAVVLLNCSAVTSANPIELSSSSKETIFLDFVKDIPTLYNWFCKNRLPQRIFDYNPKHGDENNLAWMISGTNRRAAQLEVSKAEAQRLLELAVGSDTSCALWFYDAQRKKHIYFENQQEERLAFHGYHLQPGEENYDNIDMDQLTLLKT